MSLFFAIVTVVVLLALTMGWREAVVVSCAVPISFALALFVNYLSGYTINRVTLFALILSLGLVVDDPITNVDNVQRHILAGRKKNALLATLFGVDEVVPPVIMSTLAIIVSFIPMFFITGMMGPYMGPMAINVPLTVTFSTLCALTIVPWMSYHLLKHKFGKKKNRRYRRTIWRAQTNLDHAVLQTNHQTILRSQDSSFWSFRRNGSSAPFFWWIGLARIGSLKNVTI